MSDNQKGSFDQVIKKIKLQQTADWVKSHYFFKFLNIGQPHLVEKSELEQALIGHFQQFITELSNGFCFETRQKRILIGDEYYFLEFYSLPNKTLVEYAIADSDLDIFVSKYQLQLPDKAKLEAFINNELRNV